ncbi:MAG: insulinase family protein [Deltaproteobacteria bacterium]|nr:insulinase family protein [Deltaproteobacteria bacterium]
MARIRSARLDNGIRVITERMPDVESSSIGIWVKTGSRNETPALSGVSHFIEHLLFKGTDTRSALDISREIESVGGVLNAFTGRETTCFYAKVLNKDLPLAIDLLSDIFMHSKFASEEMDKERMVVLQEIKMVEDTPDDLIHDLFAERFWKGHPLGWSILGSAETVSNMKREDVIAHFKERYCSSDVLITSAGGLDHAKVVKLLNKTLGSVKNVGKAADTGAPTPSKGVKLIKKKLEQTHICLGVPTQSQSHPDRYKLYLINTMLGGGMSSRLFQEIREKRGLAYSVYTYLNLCADTGSLVAYAGTSKDSFNEVVRLILREFSRLAKDVEPKELENAKEQLKGGMLLGLETSDSRMSKIARDYICFNRVVPIKEIVDGIDAVKVREIKDLASRLLKPSNVTLVAMGQVTGRGLPAGIRCA